MYQYFLCLVEIKVASVVACKLNVYFRKPPIPQSDSHMSSSPPPQKKKNLINKHDMFYMYTCIKLYVPTHSKENFKMGVHVIDHVFAIDCT